MMSINKPHKKKTFPDRENINLVRILLVDDKEENLISLESLLGTEDDGIEYLFASSGEEALKIALKEELALILLDVQMPVMNGYEVAHYLRNTSRTRNIPIIFVTAIDPETSRMVEGFEAGAVDFLFKPLHPVITKAKVSAFVGFYLQKKELEQANQLVRNINRELEERVTERTRELTKINNDLDNFIYTASHDLKAPINNIEGLMGLLHNRLGEVSPKPEDALSLMNLIDESIIRFKNTLKDLTEVAKVGNEEITDHKKVSFEEIFQEVKFTISDLIQQFNAEISEDFSEAPEISFSKKNLRSIIYNLVSNAIKYSSPERKPIIEIRTSTKDSYIILSVADNGLGIKKESREKVFGMFKRLHDHVEGTGVGMAIVKRIIENNGGKIEMESEPGIGTTFKMYLQA